MMSEENVDLEGMKKDQRRRQKKLERRRRKAKAWRTAARRDGGAPVSLDLPLPPLGAGKMSDQLKAYARPLLDQFSPTLENANAVLRLSAVLWNLATIDIPLLREDAVEEVAAGFELPRERAEALVETMIARRRTLFADEPRMIVDLSVEDRGATFHLNVASAWPTPGASPMALGAAGILADP